MNGAAPATVLRACGLSRRYGGVLALDGVDLEIRSGEVLAIVGENGAGKSTLLKIFGGVVATSAGHLEAVGADGSAYELRLTSAADARRQRIALVHQELSLAESLDLTGAVLLGNETHRFGWLDLRAMRTRAAAALRRVGLELNPGTICASLSIAQRQLVEIARALATEARLLVLDEPTSSLSPRETDRLLGILDSLRRDGVAIVFVSHRLDEVMRIADRVLVLRDGRTTGELQRDGWSRHEIERLMVGRDLTSAPSSPSSTAAEVRLSLDGVVTRHRNARPVTLEVRRGEIVALAGLVGAGRTELLESIAGLSESQGTVRLDDALITGPTAARVRAGIALLPEDRARDGLLHEKTVAQNVSLSWLGRTTAPGWINPAAETAMVREAITRTQLRPPDSQREVRTLSGGNQQKCVLGRLLGNSPSVLLLDEPTRGVDVGARAEIHSAIRAAAVAGASVIFASSEMEEVLLLAHRIVVMHDGGISGELSAQGATEGTILRLATGRSSNSEVAA